MAPVLQRRLDTQVRAASTRLRLFQRVEGEGEVWQRVGDLPAGS